MLYRGYRPSLWMFVLVRTVARLVACLATCVAKAFMPLAPGLSTILRFMAVLPAIGALYVATVPWRHVPLPLSLSCRRSPALSSTPGLAHKPACCASSCRSEALGAHERQDLDLLWDPLLVEVGDGHAVGAILEGVDLAPVL